MAHLTSTKAATGLFVLGCLLALSACKQEATPEAATPVPTEAPPDVPTEVSVSGEMPFGPGPFNLSGPVAGLSDLSSYRATLILAFDGTRDGQPDQWSRTYVMLVSQQPLARQLTIQETGNPSDPDRVYMAELNGASYEKEGENSCIATVTQEGNSLAEQWELAGFLTGVIGGDEAGSETINSIASNHYTFDERAIGQTNFTSSVGEVWVAADEGYIVKYTLKTEAGTDFFGEGVEGTITWDYALTDVNIPVAIDLPADCPAGMIDAPLLPDASDVAKLPGLITFTTSTSVADAAAFYQEQLAALGWQLQGEPSIKEDSALLDFTQGEQQLSVLIDASEGTTTVSIVLGPIISP